MPEVPAYQHVGPVYGGCGDVLSVEAAGTTDDVSLYVLLGKRGCGVRKFNVLAVITWNPRQNIAHGRGSAFKFKCKLRYDDKVLPYLKPVEEPL